MELDNLRPVLLLAAFWHVRAMTMRPKLQSRMPVGAPGDMRAARRDRPRREHTREPVRSGVRRRGHVRARRGAWRQLQIGHGVRCDVRVRLMWRVESCDRRVLHVCAPLRERCGDTRAREARDTVVRLASPVWLLTHPYRAPRPTHQPEQSSARSSTRGSPNRPWLQRSTVEIGETACARCSTWTLQRVPIRRGQGSAFVGSKAKRRHRSRATCCPSRTGPARNAQQSTGAVVAKSHARTASATCAVADVQEHNVRARDLPFGPCPPGATLDSPL